MPKYIYGILLTEADFTPEPRGYRANTGVRLLLEQLRYMGAVTKHEGRQRLIVEQWGPPKDCNGGYWQDQNIRRLSSFGIIGGRVRKQVGSSTWYHQSSVAAHDYPVNLDKED